MLSCWTFCSYNPSEFYLVGTFSPVFLRFSLCVITCSVAVLVLLSAQPGYRMIPCWYQGTYSYQQAAMTWGQPNKESSFSSVTLSERELFLVVQRKSISAVVWITRAQKHVFHTLWKFFSCFTYFQRDPKVAVQLSYTILNEATWRFSEVSFRWAHSKAHNLF